MHFLYRIWKNAGRQVLESQINIVASVPPAHVGVDNPIVSLKW
jgi:hypothetical protein